MNESASVRPGTLEHEPLGQRAARSIRHPLARTLLVLTFTTGRNDSPAAGGSGKGSTRRAAAVTAMLLGALAGALLVKTSLILPLVVAAALAFVTRLAFVPAARRDA